MFEVGITEIILIFGIAARSRDFFEAALVIGTFGFVSTAAAAKFLLRGEVIEPLRDRIIGRVTLDRILDPITGKVLVEENQTIDEDLAGRAR